MADDAKIASLEEQIADLNDTIEMLTLDKEQLSIEKELAEENLRRLQEVADSKSGGAASTDTASAELVAENDKLRNALQRLHELSKAEKESASIEIGQLEERLANFEKIEKENRELGISLDGAKAELAELRQAVDASASYESMIENLTEQNLELTNRIQTMDSSSREAESAQELMEELDARQRQEINRLVKELDIAVVGKQNADLEIISLKDKCNESKRNEEKFRRIIDSLQQEEKRLKNEIGEMNERTSAVTQRTKEASDIKVTQVALVQQISVLQQHVRKLEHQCHEAKASFRRVGAIFGSSSVYMNEMPSLSQEVRLVSAGSLGTLLCSADHELLTKSTDSMMTSSSSEADQKLDPEALAALHARYPIFLRSTCVLWEAAAVALYGVEEGSDIGEGPPSPSKGKSPTKQRAVVDASNELATAVTSLVTSSGLPDQLNMCLSDMQQISSLSLSRMETSANQLQRQLLALVDKYGIPLEDCSPTVEWTSPKIVEENNYLPVILAGIQISYMAHLLTHQASDLILSGLMDKSKGLSGDLITVWSLLSSELASMNDFAECVVGSSEVPLEQKLSLLVGIRNTIARTFSELSPLDANKESIFSTELLKNAIARLRETMIGVRNISKINPDTSTLESRGQPHKLDVAKSSDILWSWIYSESTNAELSRSPAMWHRRAAQLRAKVTDWDSSDAVRKDLQTRLQRAEQSVGMKEDELKSALRRCSELETLSKVQAHAQTQGPQASSKSNDGRGKTQVPGKDTDAATRRETSTSDGALMEENKVRLVYIWCNYIYLVIFANHEPYIYMQIACN
jgi:hypothetical protein